MTAPGKIERRDVPVPEVGTAVKHVVIGGKATIIPQVVCGSCLPCTRGRSTVCDSLKVMGFQTTGAASDSFAVPSDRIVSSRAESTLIKEPSLSPSRSPCMRSGGRVMVPGARSSYSVRAQSATLSPQAAKGLGASSVMITDLSTVRLQIAARCGIEHRLDSSGKDVPPEVASRFGKDRAKVDIGWCRIASCV